VTGARGQVGRALAPLLPGAQLAGRAELDVGDADALAVAMRDADVIVHLAAMTDVDGCERDPRSAGAINDRAVRALVDAAAEAGVRVVHVSTDYVFDGTSERPYREDDPTGPLSEYGRTKLAGERHVAAGRGNVVVRTSWVFGEGRNFVRSILRAARDGRQLRVVDDQRGRPTAAADLARALAELVRRPDVTGIVHVTGDGPVASWADVAERALAAASVDVPVERITTADWAAAATGPVAPRPGNSALALDRARALGLPLRDWREAVDEYAREEAA
jgi:dTDP-4-dehydrorhamnose reductase